MAARLLPIAVVLLLALLTAAGASADGRIGESRQSPFDSQPGGIKPSGGIAVSEKEGGDIYFNNGGGLERVDEFHPDGSWARGFGFGIVPGAATATADLSSGSSTLTNVFTTTGSFNQGGLGGKIITGPGIPAGTTIIGVQDSELILSQPVTASATGVTVSTAAGPGNLPTNEQQKLVVRATAGTFKLGFISPKPGSTTVATSSLDFDASAAEVQLALEGLSNIGAGNVSVSGGPGDASGSSPYTITFQGRYADTNVFPISVTNISLSGGNPSSSATDTTEVEGGGLVETCTTVCGYPSADENANSGGSFSGSRPGQFNYSDAIAVDNEPGPEYGNVYVLDQRNYRIQKFDPEGHFLLMFGGEVDKGPNHPGDVCTAQYLAEGDTCGAGVPGTGPSHFYKEEPPTQAGGYTAWGRENSNSIAIGPGGTVYVGDYGRVQEFEPDGTFAGELSLPDSPLELVTAVAVDSAGDIFERSENRRGGSGLPPTQIPGIREYDSSGNLLRTFDAESGSTPTNIALDEEGDLFVSDRTNGGPIEFRAYKPTGALTAVFTSNQVTEFGNGSTEGIAIDKASRTLYAMIFDQAGHHVAVIPLPESGPSSTEEMHVTDIQPSTATLRASVNPRGFDTEYHFEYVDQASFENEGGFSSPNTQTTLSDDLGTVNRKDPVQAGISGLTPGAAYHWRVVSESHCNEAVPAEVCTTYGPGEFETLPPVSIRGLTTQTVGPELVTFKVELNPNGEQSTYRLRYGKDTGYSGGSSEGSLPIGNEFIKREVTFTGLQPNATYHFLLSAENGYGAVKSQDQTFTTEPSGAEERELEHCPNTNLREENNSVALPDCRAYEQVSAADKKGGQAFPLLLLAPSGNGAVYVTNSAFANAAVNNLATYYVARRSASQGWLSQAPIQRLAGPEYQPDTKPELTGELDRWIYGEQPGPNISESTSNAKFYSMEAVDGTSIVHATQTFIPDGEEGPFSAYDGQSRDLTRLFFGSQTRLLPSDPRPSRTGSTFVGPVQDRIYEVGGVGTPAPSLRLVAEVPIGLTFENSSDDYAQCGIDNNAITSSVTVSGLGSRLATASGATIFYTAPIEVVPGARCGEGSPNPVGLFARTGEAAPVQLNGPPASQCSSPSPCASAGPRTPIYDGASADGTRVWFTTPQPLVDGDTDATNDLYVAKLDEGGHLSELVQASAGGAGDPTPGHGAEVGDGVQGLVRLSADGSHAAFESPAVLTASGNALGQHAVEGAANLYVYDVQSAETKFVAVLDRGNDERLWGKFPGGSTMTPDGRYLLFTSRAQLTPDDTDHVQDVFRYDFQTDQLVRVSVGRRGNDSNGNDDAYPVSIGSDINGDETGLENDESRAMSADGSTIVFRTAAPLVSRDTNAGAKSECGEGVETAGCDVYEWEEQGFGTCTEAGGCIRLISDGVDPHGVPSAVISASGRDIAFQTQRNEIPADTDGGGDIYDARVDGGFRAPHPPSPCGGPEACRPAPKAEPSTPVIGSETLVTAGNAPEELHCGKGRHRAKRHGQVRCVANHHKRHHNAHHHKRSHHRAHAARRGAK